MMAKIGLLVGLLTMGITGMISGLSPAPKAALPDIMYQLDAEARILRSRILNKQDLGSFADTIPDMRKGIPTDPDEITPDFLKMASVSQQLRQEMYRSKNPRQVYNRYLQSCIACHEVHCPGPIGRIQALRIR